MKKPFKGDYPITQSFGNVWINEKGVNVYGQWGLKGHNGVDFGLPNDTRLYAPHSGKVKEALLDSGYGWYIKIESSKEGSVLAHMRSLAVKEGDDLEEGAFVGYSDNTGFSTGAHLHWGYYKMPRDRNNGYNGYIDQMPYLKEVTMEIDNSLFGLLVGKSTKWDKTHQYLELGGDPKDTAFEDAQRVIGGFKSRATDMEKRAVLAEAEIVNREEQVGRLKEQLLSEKKLYDELSNKLTQAIKSYDENKGSYDSRIEELQGKIEVLAREKGDLNKEIALLKGTEEKVNLILKIVEWIKSIFKK